MTTYTSLTNIFFRHHHLKHQFRRQSQEYQHVVFDHRNSSPSISLSRSTTSPSKTSPSSFHSYPLLSTTFHNIGYSSTFSCANCNNQQEDRLILDAKRLQMNVEMTLNRKSHFHSSSVLNNERNIVSLTSSPLASNQIMEKAEDILKYLKDKQSMNNEEINRSDTTKVLSIQNINSCIVDLAKAIIKPSNDANNDQNSISSESKIEGAILAQNILEQMEKLTPSDQPDASTYNAVLNVWAKSNGGRNAAENAEKILDRMFLRISQYKDNLHITQGKSAPDVSPPPYPNAITFHTVMDTWAKSKASEAGMKTQKLFQRMVQCHEDWKNMDIDIEPNVRTYAILIDALASSGVKDGAERASFILDEMIQRVQTQNQNIPQEERIDQKKPVKPNAIVFNSVIKAWVNNGKGGYSAQRAEEILNKMEQAMITSSSSNISDYYGYAAPTVRSYSLVLDAWAKSREKGSALKAEAILTRMYKLYEDGYDVKPNRFSFTIVIHALAHSTDRGAAHRAETILDRMLNLYIKDKGDLKPCTPTFNAAINAWSRSGEKDAGERAESILNRLEKLGQEIPDLKPDTTTFNSTITAWARCCKDDKRAIPRAEALVSRMEMLSNYEDNLTDVISPNTVTYNALLFAYGQSKKNSYIEKAEEVLDKMEGLYRNGNKNVKPNSITYTSLIDVYARSRTKGMAQNAEKIFNRMIEKSKHYHDHDNKNDLKPDIRTYSSILQACANTRGNAGEKKKALTIALKAYDRLTEESKHDSKLCPNNVTYRILLEVCGFLTNDTGERERLLEAVFLRCCQDGQLDGNALKMLRRAATPDLFDKIVIKNAVTEKQPNNKLYRVNDLPPEWSSRVTNRRSHRQSKVMRKK